MKQAVFYYCAVALVVLGSVLFGLDWQSATMSPMPPIQVVAVVMPPPPPPPASPSLRSQAANPSAAPNPVAPAAPAAPKSVTPNVVVPAPLAAPAPVVNENPANAPAENAALPVAQTPPRPLCDVTACAAAYHSFRESDCTYNPSVGPRRLCTKGVVPTEASSAPDVPASIANPEPGINPPSNARCNVRACTAAYGSFTSSDCTYQPNNGPRRVCTK
jgi:hypothetical protein